MEIYVNEKYHLLLMSAKLTIVQILKILWCPEGALTMGRLRGTYSTIIAVLYR